MQSLERISRMVFLGASDDSLCCVFSFLPYHFLPISCIIGHDTSVPPEEYPSLDLASSLRMLQSKFFGNINIGWSFIILIYLII